MSISPAEIFVRGITEDGMRVVAVTTETAVVVSASPTSGALEPEFRIDARPMMTASDPIITSAAILGFRRCLALNFALIRESGDVEDLATGGIATGIG
jgi:hypothetical protein